jgi:hypothetical protein
VQARSFPTPTAPTTRPLVFRRSTTTQPAATIRPSAWGRYRLIKPEAPTQL